MKKILAPLAILMLLLTGCGEDAAGNSEQQVTAKPAQTPSQESVPLMPEVVGREAGPAATTLDNAGIQADFVGPDGKEFRQLSTPNTTVKESSVPAGTPVKATQRVTITLTATEAELLAEFEAQQMSTRYEYTCSLDEVTVKLTIEIPADAAEMWEQAKAQEKEAREAATRAAQLSRKAVHQLKAQGCTYQDIGDVLGITAQRAQQLAQ